MSSALSWQTAVRGAMVFVVAMIGSAGGFAYMRRGYNNELLAAGLDPYRRQVMENSSSAAEPQLLEEVERLRRSKNQTLTNRTVIEYQKMAAQVSDSVNRTALNTAIVFVAMFVTIFVVDISFSIQNEKAKDPKAPLSLILQKSSIKATVGASIAALSWIIVSLAVKPVRTASIAGYAALIGAVAVGTDSFMENLLLPQTKPTK